MKERDAAYLYDKAPRRALSRCDGRRDVSAFPLRRNLAVVVLCAIGFSDLVRALLQLVYGAARAEIHRQTATAAAGVVLDIHNRCFACAVERHLEPPRLGTLT